MFCAQADCIITLVLIEPICFKQENCHGVYRKLKLRKCNNSGIMKTNTVMNADQGARIQRA